MLELLQAILLGIVQGVTEFLPISSSGHLVFGQEILGVEQGRFGLAFDVALHLGTLLAVVSFYRREVARMARAFVRSLLRRSLSEPDGRMAWLVVVATVPSAVIGYYFEGFFEGAARSPWVVILGFVINGAILLGSEALARRSRSASKLSFPEALAVGLAQTVALLPGVSRSGTTMAAGIGLNLRREEAARFSFLMSIPVIAGASLLQIGDAFSTGMGLSGALLFVVGFVVSAAVAYVTIKLFLSFVADHSFRGFAYYSFGVAAVAALLLLLSG